MNVSDEIFDIVNQERIENEECVTGLRRKIEQCGNDEDKEYYETLKREKLEHL